MAEEEEFDDVMEITPRAQYSVFPEVNDNVEWDEFGVIPKEYVPVLDLKDREEEEREEDELYGEVGATVACDWQEDETVEYSKYTTSEDQLEVKCRREYIDFNGLGDYATLHAAIREINPKHVICWHGGPAQRAFLTKRLEEDRQYAVQAAENGEAVEIMSDRTVTKMRLDEVMVRRLQKETVGDYEVW